MPELLWVEDEPDHITMGMSVLVERGYTVQHAPRRKIATDYLDNGRTFSGVILDQRMPDDEVDDFLSGTHLGQQLRSGHWGSWGMSVPLVYVTAHEGVTHQALKEQGISKTPVLVKPLRFDDIERSLLPALRPGIQVALPATCKVGRVVELRITLGEREETSVASSDEDPSECGMVAKVTSAAFTLEKREGEVLQWISETRTWEATLGLTPHLLGRALVEVEIFHLGDRVGYATIEAEIEPGRQEVGA